MPTIKFKVATDDIPGMPGASKGDPLFPVASEIVECYEYDVWRRLTDGEVVKTRVGHRESMVTVVAEYETLDDREEAIMEAIANVQGS
jgi:hypothetical protein